MVSEHLSDGRVLSDPCWSGPILEILDPQADINIRPLNKSVCLEDRLHKGVQAGFYLEGAFRFNMPIWG